jgi:hypothetical protein
MKRTLRPEWMICRNRESHRDNSGRRGRAPYYSQRPSLTAKLLSIEPSEHRCLHNQFLGPGSATCRPARWPRVWHKARSSSSTCVSPTKRRPNDSPVRSTCHYRRSIPQRCRIRAGDRWCLPAAPDGDQLPPRRSRKRRACPMTPISQAVCSPGRRQAIQPKAERQSPSSARQAASRAPARFHGELPR